MFRPPESIFSLHK